MKVILYRFAALLMLTAVAACASPAKQESMIPTAVAGIGKNAKFANALAVRNVIGGKKTNPLWVSNISSEAFKASLTKALQTSGYQSAAGPFQVDAKLIEVKQPLIGIDMTVTTVVEYTVIDGTGTSVFKKTIRAPYTAKFSDSLLGVERLRLANEGAGRENIRLFIEALGSA